MARQISIFVPVIVLEWMAVFRSWWDDGNGRLADIITESGISRRLIARFKDEVGEAVAGGRRPEIWGKLTILIPIR
ncbi:MAG: hypothetical protein KBE23_12925 [Chloroflexi bacterium]|nr:hypothetical protein [Chloroflexota bacterium]MBP7043642.1 hypothetical protein [Chloroflexota bacterium]